MTGIAAGTLAELPVEANISSRVETATDGSKVRIGHITVLSKTCGSMQPMLASLASSVRTNLGMSVPRTDTAAAISTNSSSSGTTSAEVVFDSTHGVRMLSVSLGCAKISLSDVARRLGIAWPSAQSGPAVSFSSPWLSYIPGKPDAHAMEWNGRQLAAGTELAVAATVDVPAVNILAARATMTVQSGGRMTMQVGVDGTFH
jgi:hypothetical protein